MAYDPVLQPRRPRRHGDDAVSRRSDRAGSAAGAGAPTLRSRLFRKYVLMFVLAVGVALLASGLGEVLTSYKDHMASLIRIQREQADAVAGKIGQFILEIEAQIGWTTQLPLSDSSLEVQRIEALRLLRLVPAISEIARLDSSGHERLFVSRYAASRIDSNDDLSREPKFLTAMAHKSYYGPVYFRQETEPYMTLAVAGVGRDIGVSVAEVNLKMVGELVSQIKVGEHGQAYVVDADGRLIAHRDMDLVLSNTDLSHLAQVQAARSHESGAAPLEAKVATDLSGHQVLTANAAIAPLGWLVFIELPLEEAYAPLY